MMSFFGIWTVVWAILYAVLIPGKGPLDKGPVIAVIYAVVVIAASWLFLDINDQGWQSNRLLSIGIGGGIGWVMMLNVWGVIWRIQKNSSPGLGTTRRTERPFPSKPSAWPAWDSWHPARMLT